MQHHNINRTNIINPKVSSILVADFKNVVSDIGISFTYYCFSDQFKDWTRKISAMKGYVMSSDNERSGSFEVKDRYEVLISAESFFSNGTLLHEPNKSDKVNINGTDYHVVDLHFYNVQAELTNKIRNAMAVSVELIIKGGFTRADIMRG